MITDFEQFEKKARRPAITIIGSGPAAIALAFTLEEHGFASALLESGNNQPLQWNIPFEPLDPAHYHPNGSYSQLHLRREIGGGFNVWGAWSSTMREINFSRSDIEGYPQWPISKASLRPHFERACRLLRITDPDHCWPDEIPVIAEQGLYAKGFSFPEPVRYPDFERRIQESTLVTLVTGATVIRVSKVEGNKHFMIVEHASGQSELVCNGAIVAAGGAVGNARFLARSAASLGLAKSVQNLVGTHATEHPHCYSMGLVLFRPQIAAAIESSEGKSSVITSLIPHGSYLLKNKLTDFNFQLLPPTEDMLGPREKAIVSNYRATYGAAPQLYQVTLGMEQLPVARNRVLNDESLSGANDGYLDMNFDRQLSIIPAAKKWLFSQGVHAWMARGTPRIQTVGHLHGTTRMSRDPGSGVVDADCRVFGTGAIYMTGSSVFPTAGFVNPTMNLVTLAIRLGDHLAGANP